MRDRVTANVSFLSKTRSRIYVLQCCPEGESNLGILASAGSGILIPWKRSDSKIPLTLAAHEGRGSRFRWSCKILRGLRPKKEARQIPYLFVGGGIRRPEARSPAIQPIGNLRYKTGRLSVAHDWAASIVPQSGLLHVGDRRAPKAE